jgi:hypothetical protein
VRLDPDDAIAELNEDNNAASAPFVVAADNLAPTSSAGASPAANAAGWNNGNVSVALSAVDNPGGSGVRSITYSVNGSAPATANGASASVSVTAEGATTISYFATDNVGNVEPAKSLVVRIDKTAPTGTLSLSPDLLWPPNHKLVSITPSLPVSDNLGGAVTISAPVITSNEAQSADADWVVSGNSLQLRAERDGKGSGRVYTVTYTLTDQAGNRSQVSATVNVPHNQ